MNAFQEETPSSPYSISHVKNKAKWANSPLLLSSEGSTLSCWINGRVTEYIDYTEPGENHNLYIWIPTHWFDRQLKLIKSRFDQFDELMEMTREPSQRSASLEQDAWQPRLTMKVDVTAGKKNRERTDGAAAATQAKLGDSCSAKRVQAVPTSLTRFVSYPRRGSEKKVVG